MAEGKKSVLLYCDILHTVEQLDNETAGELFKHYLRYINDLNPETNNVLVKIAFEPIKQNLKRDLCKWESKQQEKSLNGRMGNLKRYHLDLYELVVSESINISEAENIAKSRKVSLSDNLDSEAINNVAKVAVKVKDKVNVTVNVKDINNIVSPKVEPKQKTFKQFTIEDFRNDIAIYKESYTSKTLNDFYIYWIEKNTKGIMKFQLQKTWETELRLKTWAKNEENFKPIQTYQKGNIVQPEPLKQENPLELLPNRIAEIYNIGQLENLGQQKCKSMFGYITKETPDKFLNESEKWYKVLYL